MKRARKPWPVADRKGQAGLPRAAGSGHDAEIEGPAFFGAREKSGERIRKLGIEARARMTVDISGRMEAAACSGDSASGDVDFANGICGRMAGGTRRCQGTVVLTTMIDSGSFTPIRLRSEQPAFPESLNKQDYLDRSEFTRARRLEGSG